MAVQNCVAIYGREVGSKLHGIDEPTDPGIVYSYRWPDDFRNRRQLLIVELC